MDERAGRPAASRAGRLTSRRTLLRRGLAAGVLLATAGGWGALAGPARLVRAAPGAASRAPGAAASPDALARGKVGDFMASRPTPGVAVALYADGQDWLLSFGYADRETQQPVTPEIVFNLGSITKVFTTTLLASQVVDPSSPTPKRLSDPVTAYLPPEVGGGALGQVTLQELATHTASMPRQAPGVRAPADQLFDDQPPTPDLLNWWRTWTPPAASPPGSHYAYSNIGVITLGYAVVGQPGPPQAPGYTALLARTISGPLQMTATATHVPAGLVLAKGYIRRGDAARLVQTRAANINSSARDMLTWVKANLGLLDSAMPETLAQAIALTHQPYFSPPANQRPPFDIGLAWEIRIRRPDSPTILTKNGATSLAGHSCAMALMPGRRTGIAVLTNAFGQGSDPTGLAIDILRTLAARAGSA